MSPGMDIPYDNKSPKRHKDLLSTDESVNLVKSFFITTSFYCTHLMNTTHSVELVHVTPDAESLIAYMARVSNPSIKITLTMKS